MNVGAGPVQTNPLGRICVSGGISNEGRIPHASPPNDRVRRYVYDAGNQVSSWWHPNALAQGSGGRDALNQCGGIVGHTPATSPIGAHGKRNFRVIYWRADVLKIHKGDYVVGSGVVAVLFEADDIARAD